MELLTDENVMSTLGIKDKRTLRKYRRHKGLDLIRIGRGYRYTQEMIDSFLIRNSSLVFKKKQ